MNNCPRRLLFLVAAMCCAVLTVGAQEPTEHWKQQNTVDGVVEGFDFDRDVALAALTLVDFHAYREPLDFDNEIIVEFLSWQPRHSRIVAREKSPVHRYYMQDRMSATFGPNRWRYPSGIVRKTRKNPPINFEHLGLVVRLGANESDTHSAYGMVAPVILRRSASVPLQDISSYSATFLPDTTVDDVSYSVHAGCEGSGGTKPVDSGSFPLPHYKDNPFTISIRPGREGLATLRVTYKVRGVDHPALTYCFWHVTKPTDPAQLHRISR